VANVRPGIEMCVDFNADKKSRRRQEEGVPKEKAPTAAGGRKEKEF